MKLPNNEALAEFLDIEDAEFEEIPSKKEPPTQVTVAVEPSTEVSVVVPISDERTDYEKTRKSLANLMKQAEQALEGALMVAENEESARAYEVVAKVLDSVSNVTDKVYGLHKKVQETIGVVQQQPQTVNVEKAVFVGTASDLLDAIEDGT